MSSPRSRGLSSLNLMLPSGNAIWGVLAPCLGLSMRHLLHGPLARPEASSETQGHQQSTELRQRLDGSARLTELQGSARGIQLPRRNDADLIGRASKVNEESVATRLDLLHRQPQAAPGVPRVVDSSALPDMGRMNGASWSDVGIISGRRARQGLRSRRCSTPWWRRRKCAG